MSHLLALSFDVAASPSIWLGPDRSGVDEPGGTGWGFAWYPEGNESAAVIRDPRPVRETGLTDVLRDWDRFRSTIFVCHVRGAAKRPTERDTHPFTRAYARRDFMFAHNGQLDPAAARGLPLGDRPVFEPVGTTDSEHAFCWLLTKIRDRGARALADVPWAQLHEWFGELNRHGTFNCLMSDGLDVVAYSDSRGFRPLHFARLTPPHANTRLDNGVVRLDYSDPLDVNRTMLAVATRPMGQDWSRVGDGQLLVSRLGSLRHWTGEPSGNRSSSPGSADATWLESKPDARAAGDSRVDVFSSVVPQVAANGTARRDDDAASVARYQVVHKTRYEYGKAVERSTHALRLEPARGLYQRVIEHELQISVPHERTEFEDVFGNRAVRVLIRDAYDQLEVTARSVVEVVAQPSMAPRDPATLPLVWMPWQRQMMAAFLLPPELPETQLRELSAFAMSFAEREDFDVVETLRSLNSTIRSDFNYIQNVTSLETTPFEVYVNRRGVCQDFANLFICLARLLGVPSRYRVGYIHTGADYDNQIQSEASHAWAEVYLPWYGWRGFDPTNGCLAGLDHVGVAVGRNFRDATPTSGTLFKGGGNERLEVSVEIERI